LCPGDLAFKSVVTATIAAAQAAYYLAIAEYSLSNAVDAVRDTIIYYLKKTNFLKP
jgi:hypothetical protein